jgi:magnesium-transporting ATPase (P-type)
MSTLHSDAERGDRLLAFTKGAPDVLLARCSHELVGADPRPLTLVGGVHPVAPGLITDDGEMTNDSSAELLRTYMTEYHHSSPMSSPRCRGNEWSVVWASGKAGTVHPPIS